MKKNKDFYHKRAVRTAVSGWVRQSFFNIKELGAVKAEKLKKLKRMKLLYVDMELHGIII